MDLILTNTGFQHLAFQIFDLLDSKSLKNSRLVSKGWQKFVDRYTEVNREIWTQKFKKLKITEFKHMNMYGKNYKIFFSHYLSKVEVPDTKMFVKLMKANCSGILMEQ